MKKVFNISTKSSETDTNKPSKKRKVFRTLGFSSLALLMGAAGVFAFAPLGNAPMSPNTLNASATTQGQTFDLGLDPQNDPVVYTTESGLQIKKSNGKYSSTTSLIDMNGNSIIQDLRSFYYFTMGTFSGTTFIATTNSYVTVTNVPVNWLIIGRGPGFNFEESTPAGTGIKTDRDKEEIATSALNLPNFFTTVRENSEIGTGCMLALSECTLGISTFNTNDSSGQSSRYRYTANGSNGTLYTAITNLYNSGLGLTNAQKQLIQPQYLKTVYGVSSSWSATKAALDDDTTTKHYFFPLASYTTYNGYPQNFCYDSYLNQAQRIARSIGSTNATQHWTRTGYPVYGDAMTVGENGGYKSGNYMYVGGTNIPDNGVRPAFVLRIS